MPSDTDPGVGVGTPIGGSPPSVPAASVYTPPIYTLLPLAEYAKIMGINPIQFMSATAPALFADTGCTDRWRQYAWQDDTKVSRSELAYEIMRAEKDIAAELRYWPGPTWTEDEVVQYPQFHRKGYVGQFGHDSNGRMKSIKLTYGKFIAGGKRALTFVGTATTTALSLIYEDNDGDGFNETARVSIATTLTDACELKLYFSGKGGQQEWEIRPLRSKVISGGFLEISLDSWLLLDPDLLAAFPGPNPTGFQDIDATVAGNYVTGVDIYREYNDPAEQASLLWEGSATCVCSGTGCVACGFETQVGCLVSRDDITGLVSVVPGDYAAGTNTWTQRGMVQGFEPHKVRASYRSGISQQLMNGCDGVPYDLALAITYMVTARLSRPLCTNCVTLRKREEELKEDLIFINPGGDATRFVTREILNCPFGTKYGELEAWRIVRDRLDIGERNLDVAIV